jgi:hypothetical protein
MLGSVVLLVVGEARSGRLDSAVTDISGRQIIVSPHLPFGANVAIA